MQGGSCDAPGPGSYPLDRTAVREGRFVGRFPPTRPGDIRDGGPDYFHGPAARVARAQGVEQGRSWPSHTPGVTSNGRRVGIPWRTPGTPRLGQLQEERAT